MSGLANYNVGSVRAIDRITKSTMYSSALSFFLKLDRNFFFLFKWFTGHVTMYGTIFYIIPSSPFEISQEKQNKNKQT